MGLKGDLDMITIKHKGDFSKLTKYFKNVQKAASEFFFLEKYGVRGVEALSSATPVDSGLTASSWFYEIKRESGKVSIVFHNSNVQKGVNIAVILQYGHGTRNGGYVVGRDYINPAIQSVFDDMAKKAWEEVTKA